MGVRDVTLASAFPKLLREGVFRALSVLPEPFHECMRTFCAVVTGEAVRDTGSRLPR